METTTLLAIVSFSLVQAYNPPAFSFNNKLGASQWPDAFATYCSSSKQSPIDIVTKSTKYDEPLNTSTLFTSQDTDRRFLVKNVGFQLEVDVKNVQFRGLHLPDELKVAGFHFHWGDKDSVGSAHTLNGQSFPLEVHIVLINEKYGDQIMQHSDGIIGLAVFFKIGQHNSVLQSIINVIQNVTKPGAEVYIDSFSLENLLPPVEKRTFYRYNGSVDVPVCEEAVEWTVFAHPLEVSAQQLSHFRTMQAAVPNSNATFQMVNNFRPVQPLNGRIVRRSSVEGSANAVLVNIQFMFVLMVASAAYMLQMRGSTM